MRCYFVNTLKSSWSKNRQQLSLNYFYNKMTPTGFLIRVKMALGILYDLVHELFPTDTYAIQID